MVFRHVVMFVRQTDKGLQIPRSNFGQWNILPNYQEVSVGRLALSALSCTAHSLPHPHHHHHHRPHLYASQGIHVFCNVVILFARLA